MEEIMNQINALIAKPQIKIDGVFYTLEIVLGGDYKVCSFGQTQIVTSITFLQFLLLMLRLNQATANYSCVWCHVHKDKRYIHSSIYVKRLTFIIRFRYDTSLLFEHYTSSNMKRTLTTLKERASLPKSRPASQ